MMKIVDQQDAPLVNVFVKDLSLFANKVSTQTIFYLFITLITLKIFIFFCRKLNEKKIETIKHVFYKVIINLFIHHII